MKKVFLLATTAMLMVGAVSFANGGGGKTGDCKTCTKKHCTGKECAKECPKGKCDKS